MIQVAIAADLHLADRSNSVKEQVWQWVLSECRRRNVDLFVGAGDLTGIGTLSSAQKIISALQTNGIPFMLTPGNAELRTPADKAATLELMQTEVLNDTVVLFDSSCGRLSTAASQLLSDVAAGEKRNLLAVTHCPAEAWEADDQEMLRQAMERGVIAKLVYGHKHYDRQSDRFDAIRGLDPDKAIGGAPALALYRYENGGWEREDVICPDADMEHWQEELRREFFAGIGICGMKTPVEYLNYAAINNIGAFELRYNPELFEEPEFLPALEAWRNAGGKYLSMHLTDLKFENGVFTGGEKLDDAVARSVQYHCNGVTMHVPRGFQDELAEPEIYALAVKSFVQHLKPLWENGIQIGIENLHSVQTERENKRYKFGCTVPECLNFISALRAAAPADARIGLHLDIGHARNNAPFCHQDMLSEWYAAAGSEIVAMHIHQVSRTPENVLKNHTGFTSLYGAMISLSGLGMAWKCGQIGRVPMFLELRTPAPECYETLRRSLKLD